VTFDSTSTNNYSTPDPFPSNALDAALAYAKMGIPVFPLHSTDGHGNCDCSQQVCGNAGKHP
jgi:hypothetical protein